MCGLIQGSPNDKFPNQNKIIMHVPRAAVKVTSVI